ncbi:MAG: PP2C family protein-serine/threonine phosphatase [Planctomycetaceae bacterium]
MNYQTAIQVAALTDVGMRRNNNQDSHSVLLADSAELWKTRGHLLMVADGMGGHAGGELASKLTTDTVPHLYHKHKEDSAPEALERAIREANSEVHRRGRANPDFYNMGTTCTTMAILPEGAVLAHVGDSRAYRLRGDRLEQLTFDHSVQWELRAAGLLKEGSELAHSVPKNQITRSVGPNERVQADIEGPWPIELNDTFLLCSDGLTGRVEDEEIGLILGCLEPKDAAQVLIDLANLRGGPDNITVIVARVVNPAITTAASGNPTLTVGGSKQLSPVHPAIWIVSAACLLLGLFLTFASAWIPAGVAALGGIAAGILGLSQRYRGYRSGIVIGQGRRLGKGPYTVTVCTPNQAFCDRLKRVLAELREAVDAGGWDINWPPYEALYKNVEASEKSGNHAQAVRFCGQAISYLMKELRRQGPRTANDSAIGY